MNNKALRQKMSILILGVMVVEMVKKVKLVKEVIVYKPILTLLATLTILTNASPSTLQTFLQTFFILSKVKAVQEWCFMCATFAGFFQAFYETETGHPSLEISSV